MKAMTDYFQLHDCHEQQYYETLSSCGDTGLLSRTVILCTMVLNGYMIEPRHFSHSGVHKTHFIIFKFENKYTRRVYGK